MGDEINAITLLPCYKTIQRDTGQGWDSRHPFLVSNPQKTDTRKPLFIVLIELRE
jgi:hypothetical protein